MSARPLEHGELAMLRADRERLDWLSTVTADSWVELGHDPDTGLHWVCEPEFFDPAASRHGLRAAIDAAMERERGQ
jgi:hypothetical protein